MVKFIKITTYGCWWQGEIAVKYDLKRLLFYLFSIIILAAVVFITALIFGFRGCSSDKHVSTNETSVAVVTPEYFNEVFNWVVTSRAYLDGVQTEDNVADRALVGLKFVNGQPVTQAFFESKTYDEAVQIIAEDWRDLIVANLNGVLLSQNQLIAVTLFAMRNGKSGFMQSDFLHELQTGHTKGAEALMALHKADGTKRQLGEEARQYLWVLMQIYNGNVDYKDLLDMPIMSYRALYVGQIYDKRGNARFSKYIRTLMQQGSRPTSKAALEL